MTRKVGNIVHIENTPKKECELCGVVAELRPYGPNGENICSDCGRKDEDAVNRGLAAMFYGPGEKTQ